MAAIPIRDSTAHSTYGGVKSNQVAHIREKIRLRDSDQPGDSVRGLQHTSDPL